MLSIRSKPFTRFVSGLKKLKKSCTVVESCCGGLISSSIMAEPGASAIYYGGSVAYNTRKAKKLLLNDENLHSSLLLSSKGGEEMIEGETEGDKYIRSKLKWTAATAVAFCEQMDVDYAIAEGGAAGPTFRPEGLNVGFAAIAIAGREKGGDGSVKVLAQKVVHSTHADREQNMRLFADAAADLASDTIGIEKNDTKTLSRSKSTEWENDANHIILDRATIVRSDPDKIKYLELASKSKYVVVCPSSKECLFASSTELALVGNQDIPPEAAKTFLGLDQHKTPYFTVDVDSCYIPPSKTYFLPTRTNAPLLTKSHNELALYATAISTWKHTHKYCSKCGSPQTPIHGGTCLKCLNPSCNTLSWPRQDPSIIVLITSRDQSKALLARSPRHPLKMHTALAGFVEAGESFEQAVCREAKEETGVSVDIDSITYLTSQPWPFPRSCMIAFRATADDSLDLEIDENELVSATWFEKEHVRKASTLQGPMMEADVARKALQKDPSLQVLIPPKGVVARSLIDNWLQQS